MAVETRAQGSLIGSTLGGYEVEALVGRGAMGSVYLARDTNLNRHVALKVLLGSLARTPAIVKQFHQEAQAAAPLNHPAIVRMYSAGIEDGTPYIAMEFVDGEPLDRFIKRKGKVSWDLALHIGAQVALALDCAHRHGVVHRDVKPSNILLDRRGGVRLTDFGIARVQEEGESASDEVIGTPQYMSPEQVTAAEVGPASDLFSLGVTLYQLISGEMPFRAESSMGLIKSICEDDPPRLNRLIPSVPDDVARLVAYLMEKDPDSRPANAKVAYGLIHRLQKQRGGASALHESLTSFIQEEMEPRPFSSLAQKEARSRRRDAKLQRQSASKRRPFAWRYAMHVCLVGALALGAMSAGPFNASRARARTATAPIPVELATRQAVSPGVERILFFLDGYEMDDVAWLENDAGLLIRVRGQRGTLTDAAVGLLGFERNTGQVLSLGSPVLASTDLSAHRRTAASRYAVPQWPLPPTSDLRSTFLVMAPRGQGSDAVLLAQPWRSGTPRPQILYEGASTFPPAGVPHGEWQAPGPVAVHPSGERVCLLLYDEHLGFAYLAERDIRDHALGRTSRARTPPGADILVDSVQYTPDGERLAYLRVQDDGNAELWMVATGGTGSNGTRIAGGVAGDAFALSPDGARIALPMEARRAGGSEIAVVDARTGDVQARYGPGKIAKRAWLPDGSGFFFVSRDAVPKLMFASAMEPYATTAVTALREGLTDAFAVSADGRHIAAVARGGQVPSLYVLEWNRLISNDG